MYSVELKITLRDWLYIIIIGAFFGFFISLCFYFLSYDLQNISTIVFSTASAVFVYLFAFLLNYIKKEDMIFLHKLNH